MGVDPKFAEMLREWVALSGVDHLTKLEQAHLNGLNVRILGDCGGANGYDFRIGDLLVKIDSEYDDIHVTKLSGIPDLTPPDGWVVPRQPSIPRDILKEFGSPWTTYERTYLYCWKQPKLWKDRLCSLGFRENLKCQYVRGLETFSLVQVPGSKALVLALTWEIA